MQYPPRIAYSLAELGQEAGRKTLRGSLLLGSVRSPWSGGGLVPARTVRTGPFLDPDDSSKVPTGCRKLSMAGWKR